MNLCSPLVPFALSVLAYISFIWLARFLPDKGRASRFNTIDGMRGYLAIFVFIHHASIWNKYVRTGIWESPDTNFFNHLGTGSVVLFFMISSFLFFGKISRSVDINWFGLAISRFLRMTPLYVVAMLFLFLFVSCFSGFRALEDWGTILPEAMHWMMFSVFGSPNINAIQHTGFIIAGVVWSLPYEWAWYGVLPLFALLIHRKISMLPALVGLASAGYALIHLNVVLLLPFGGGIVAYWLSKSQKWNELSKGKLGSPVAVLTILLAVLMFKTANNPISVVLYAISFSMIVSGADLFGILSNKVSIALGEISYDIYLFHGFVLCILVGLILRGSSAVSDFNVYWLCVASIIPVLLVICLLLHLLVEYPAMHSKDTLLSMLNNLSKKISRKEG